jgi:hypothetical protein
VKAGANRRLQFGIHGLRRKTLLFCCRSIPDVGLSKVVGQGSRIRRADLLAVLKSSRRAPDEREQMEKQAAHILSGLRNNGDTSK